MAKEEIAEAEHVEEIPDVEEQVLKEVKERKTQFNKEAWKPKTSTGKKAKSGEINNIDEILDNGIKIMEAEIVDALVPNLVSDLLLIGQSKGKFGGGKRRIFKQTQKKTAEGNKPHFATFAIIGDEDGHIGAGYGKSKETVPAREKALRNAKLNIIKIRRGCGSWLCGCKEPHTIPFAVSGKCGSVRINLIPAPKGTGLCAQNEVQKILKMAGFKDIWSKTEGQTRTTINLVNACIDALKKLVEMKVMPEYYEMCGLTEGSVGKKEAAKAEE